jgi:hypothetical protein
MWNKKNKANLLVTHATELDQAFSGLRDGI